MYYFRTLSILQEFVVINFTFIYLYRYISITYIQYIYTYICIYYIYVYTYIYYIYIVHTYFIYILYIYFCLAETTFKERYKNIELDVTHIRYQYNTELTKYIWNLKNNSIKHNIQYSKLLIKFMVTLIQQCVSCVWQKSYGYLITLMTTTYWIKSQNLVINANI